MLTPSTGIPGPDDETYQGPFWAELANWNWQDALYYMTAVSLVEPFYVTAGFALYLNRRAILEGWDIELALRRLEERVTAPASVPAAMIAIAALCCLLSLPHAAHAADSTQKSAHDEIQAVLKSPEFSQHKDETRWHYIGESKPDRKQDSGLSALLVYLSALLGKIAEFGIWIAVAVLLVAALYYLRRYIPEPRLRKTPRYRPPDALFGFDLAPESLPGDVAGAAAEMARRGELREALSLLYRGALSALVHRHHLPLGSGDTEEDCSRAVSRALPSSAGYFARLVGAWESIAYAARTPDAAGIQQLCEEWRSHFSGIAST
jgi:hypothetical protein